MTYDFTTTSGDYETDCAAGRQMAAMWLDRGNPIQLSRIVETMPIPHNGVCIGFLHEIGASAIQPA